MNSKDVGTLGEHLAIVELLKLGVEVSRPLGDNSRYDIIIDNNGILLTCQIKSTISSTDDLAEFWLSSSQAHRGHGRSDYNNIVDCFLLVDVLKSKIFILSDTSKKSIKIRYTKPSGTNQHSINYAEDYYLNIDTLNNVI